MGCFRYCPISIIHICLKIKPTRLCGTDPSPRWAFCLRSLLGRVTNGHTAVGHLPRLAAEGVAQRVPREFREVVAAVANAWRTCVQMFFMSKPTRSNKCVRDHCHIVNLQVYNGPQTFLGWIQFDSAGGLSLVELLVYSQQLGATPVAPGVC